MSSAKRSRTGKPGRPKGSRTKQRPVVEEHPPSCPACGSVDRTKKQQTRKLDTDGKTIRWYTVSCKVCPQQYTIKTIALK